MEGLEETMTTLNAESKFQTLAPTGKNFSEILTPETVEFTADLVGRSSSKRKELLEKRAQRQVQLDRGVLPDFLNKQDKRYRSA